jgi:3-oxoadipate enol-lactonase
MPFHAADKARIYFKVDGAEGAANLVLLNSIGTDMDLWDGVLPSLRSHFTVLRIDTRGHGASDAPDGDYAMAMLAEDVLGVMEEAGMASAAVVGVSLGGMIAMELALLAPARVTALALVCTSATMDSNTWRDRVDTVRAHGMASIADLAMGRFLSSQFAAARPEVAAASRRQLLAMDPQGYAGCGAAIRDMNLASRLSQIACPTLVVSGTRDTSTPYDGHGEHLERGIAGAIHASLDAAHLAPLENPSELFAALIGFFETKRGGP